MNIRIEKTNTTNTLVTTFLALENLKLYLSLRCGPKMKEFYNQNKESFTETFIRDYTNSLSENGVIYAAYIDNTIQGAGYINEDNYLNSLFVSEEYRNMGIGSSILERLIDECIKLGAIRVDANLDAITLYERFNFEKVQGVNNKHSVSMELKERKNGK